MMDTLEVFRTFMKPPYLLLRLFILRTSFLVLNGNPLNTIIRETPPYLSIAA